ncbi:MAG: hypothetical protein CVU50_05395 [Candidatus Cloacimonetes bacterium HGW-Cloacimonetes-3]|jgi:DNA-binding NtrC family response regulator|nr:MAG: hypothetical protein CVU50_05395 [Candidatus Cloacimonetes bacterium HGW-Cloacimonetes-3]
MKQSIDEQAVIQLEHLTEADPMQFMLQYEALFPNVSSETERNTLQYLYARALVTMNQKQEAEELVLNLLSSAVEQVNYLMIARCNIILSRCYTDSDVPDKQKRCMDIAIVAAKKSQGTRIITECMMYTGTYYLAQNDRVNAIKFFTKAEKLCQEVQDMELTLQLKIALGNAYYRFSEHHRALAYLAEAFQLALEMGDVNRQLLIINNLSTLYTMLNRFDDAESILNKGIKISGDNVIPVRKLHLMFNLGVLYLQQKLYQPALDNLLDCKAYADTLGFEDPRFLIELYSNLAGCYRYLDNSATAVDYLHKATLHAKQMNSTMLANEIELNRANLLLNIGELAEAKKTLLGAKKYFTKHKQYPQLVVTTLNLSDYYEIKKDYSKAITTLKDIDPIYREYMATVMNDKTNEFDKQLKALMSKLDRVQDDYTKLASRFTNRMLGKFVGQSSQHQKVLETAMLAAQHPSASVLITGESGTGKDVIANLIHMNSIRSSGPFVAVNVSAISPSLMESEFFGHRKGSFTGAINDHKGFFLQANHGTLFLDEIGDMPKELQSKLLRVLESRKVTPVGASAEISFDCRIICSTNRKLEEMLSADLFRLDLFHRLNTLEIHIPPLRSRPEDILPLVEHYAELLAEQNNRPKPVLDSSFVKHLKLHPFPGNVRELKNMIERLFILCPGNIWDENALSLLPLEGKSRVTSLSALSHVTQQAEKDTILKALQEAEGKQKDAARILNMSESTLTRRIEKHHLEIYTRKGK